LATAVGGFPAIPGFRPFDPMFETITFWIIVAWFIAGVWMIVGSFGGPSTAGRGGPVSAVSGTAEIP
jgi:hypothetical protein